MIENILEKAIRPYNTSSKKIVYNNRYHLFAPVASDGNIGMAGYNDLDFDIDENHIVSISDVFKDKLLERVTKESIGLGSVENFGTASPEEAEAGTADNKYMTPLKSRQGFLKMKLPGGLESQRWSNINDTRYLTAKSVTSFSENFLQIGELKRAGFDCKLNTLLAILTSDEYLYYRRAGIIYRVDEAFTTTGAFVEGAGHSYPKDTLIRMVRLYLGDFKYTIHNPATDINYNATKNVKEAIEDLESKLLGVYSPKGNKTATELLAITPDISNLNFVWNVTEPFTTTDKFVEGVGIDYPAGTNVAVLKIGSEYKFDILGGIYNKAEDIIYNDSNVKDEITNLKTTKADLSECVEKEASGRNYTDYVKDVASLNDIYFTYNGEEVSQELVDGWNVIGAVPYEYRGKIGTNRGSVVTDGTSIYIIGGAYTDTDSEIFEATNLMLIYNIANNSWKSKELPYYMRTTSAVYEPINKDIYIMGGIYNTDGSSGPTMFPKYYKYNTITEIFTEIATPPIHFAGANGINLYNGTHIIIPLGGTVTENGGIFSTSVHNGEILSYEISTNTWSQIATQPYKTNSGASAIIDDILYIQRSKAMNDSYFAAYNLINNTWNETPLALPNRNVVHMTGIEYDGKYMISGGYNTLNPEGTYYGDIQLYDPATNSWSTHSVLNNKIGNGIGYGGFVKVENEDTIDLYYINGLTNSGTDINELIVNNEHLVYKYSQKRVVDLNKVLDFKAETIETSVTIDTTDWVADGPTATYKAVKTVSGVLLSDNPIISFDLTGIADTAWTTSRTEFAKIGLASTTDDDEITFYASAIPSEDITVTVKVVR